jgi:excisionase family DNA binding protein
MTVADVAAMLRRSERTIRTLIADGKLPAQRVGRAYRILRSDVDRLVANELVASSPPPPDISPLPESLREQLFSPREVADLLDETEGNGQAMVGLRGTRGVQRRGWRVDRAPR